MSATIRWRTTSRPDSSTNDRPGMPSRMSRTIRSPDRDRPSGRSIWVTSPVTTHLEPNPSRVRNIFICSAVVFWASSRMMNESLRVLWVRMKSSVTYSESGAETWIQTASAVPAGSMLSTKRIGRPPPDASYFSSFLVSLKGSRCPGSRISTMWASLRWGTSRPFAQPGARPAAGRVRHVATPPSERTRNTTSSRRRGDVVQ